jgi:hypothetical protein
MSQQSYSSERKHFAADLLEPSAVSLTADEQRSLLNFPTRTSPMSSSQTESPNNETTTKVCFSKGTFSLPTHLENDKTTASESMLASREKTPGVVYNHSSERAEIYSSHHIPVTVTSNIDNRKAALFESSFHIPMSSPTEPTLNALNRERHYRTVDPQLTTSNELSNIWKRGRKQKYAHLSAEERKAIRAAQNREATRRSRERSRVRYEMMVEELGRLRKENAELWRSREIILGLLKQHNISIPKSAMELIPTSSTLDLAKELEVSPCSEYGRDSYSSAGSYPLSDLPSWDISSRTTALLPHM